MAMGEPPQEYYWEVINEGGKVKLNPIINPHYEEEMRRIEETLNPESYCPYCGRKL